MSRAEAVLQAWGRRWKLTLPEAFLRVYETQPDPVFGPCAFLLPEEVESDDARWCGMIPQFLPFGHDGDSGIYGFYSLPGLSGQECPILFYDGEGECYFPLASNFDRFLRWCAIAGRYEEQDIADEDVWVFSEKEARRLGIEEEILQKPVPRNEREYYEQLVEADPRSPFSLVSSGCIHWMRGSAESARDLFTRAAHISPWYADPFFFLGEMEAAEQRLDQAIPFWWQAVRGLLDISTSTDHFEMSEEFMGRQLYGLAAERLVDVRDLIPLELSRSPFGHLLLEEDPYEAAARIELGDHYRREGDIAEAERQYLNALPLAMDERQYVAAYETLIAFYEQEGRERDAALCRMDLPLCLEEDEEDQE